MVIANTDGEYNLQVRATFFDNSWYHNVSLKCK